MPACLRRWRNIQACPRPASRACSAWVTAAPSVAFFLRLARDGQLERGRDGRWRLPTQEEQPIVEEEEPSEFEAPERAGLPAFDPRQWVKPVNLYVIFNPSPFACRRHG
jgi:hypothetical protein